jgi:hypothetical protein
MRSKRTIAAAAALALGVGGAGTAAAAQHAAAPGNVTVKAIARSAFKANRYIQDGARYDRDVYTIRSGGTITFRDAIPKGGEGPHTLTVLRRSRIPATLRAVNACGNAGQAEDVKNPCGAIAKKHGATQTGVKNVVVNAGRPGLDQAGDSYFVSPNGAPGSSIRIRVSAAKGTNLSFICLVHPWMQAKLQVR